MPVLGIDLGSQNCVVGIAKKGSIDIVTNEFSRRYTPVYVSFSENERLIGESGMGAQISHYQRTISLIKRFIGLKYSQLTPEVLHANISVPIFQGPNDEILFKIDGYKLHDNDAESKLLSPVQLLGMLFGKIVDDVESSVGFRESDCVITVPCYFNEIQRRDVVKAAEIAGLNVIRVMHDVTAAALGYGIYKDFPEEAQNIAFVDVGHLDTSVYIIEFKKSQLRVLSCASDPNLGAYALEKALYDHYVEEIKTKYKMDVTTNPKAVIRLARECEKLKKFLSSNPVSNLRIECLMNEKDIQFQIKRDEYIQLVQPVLSRFEAPVKRALESAGITAEQLTTVELLGGASYIPVIRETLAKIIGKEVQSTLNTTESVAKGAAIQAAMISPKFTLAREFNVIDSIYHGVNLGWVANPESDDKMVDDDEASVLSSLKQSTLFKQFEGTPSSKMLTFNKSKTFDLFTVYSDPSLLPAGTSSIMGKFTITDIPQRNEPLKIKIKMRHNMLGLVEVQEATASEEIEVEEEEPIPKEELEQNKMDTTEEVSQEKPAEEKKDEKPKTRLVKKKKTIKHNLKVLTTVPGITTELFNQYLNVEQSMRNRDKDVRTTAEAKNNVESFCYNMKERLYEGGDLYEFINDQDRDNFILTLDDTESWLYGDGENTTKTVYQEKLAELKKVGDRVENRLKEFEARPEGIKQLQETIKEFQTFVDNANTEQYNHITNEEKQKVADKVSETNTWLNEQLAQQDKVAKSSDPILTCAFIENRKKDLRKVATPIVTKPKPKEEPKKEEKPTEQKQEPEQNKKMDETQ
ncbi:predicted protein [Naegleria gruberi]|uniref:Predicted protein n=1 Tax=Naegleria gruberi TaxID=5762 RepID=D2UY06_NAEGR|nr:uncharacterized protein NAEGRDRAFT_37170 [Naegleria gruberi]EFC50714.1 predicted protein [Naegleria gruberi]|eukprot:XP_002683458.1 predicted protein [Naegleria gruberi strain NEG-M]